MEDPFASVMEDPSLTLRMTRSAQYVIDGALGMSSETDPLSF